MCSTIVDVDTNPNVPTTDDYLVAEIKAFEDDTTLGWVTVHKEGENFVLTLPAAWTAGTAVVGQTDQGIHIHANENCHDAASVGGHFYTPVEGALADEQRARLRRSRNLWHLSRRERHRPVGALHIHQ